MNDKVIGNSVQVNFPQLGRAVEGKVDTGATTSSLHAENIQLDEKRGTVTFVCPELSQNRITLEMDGTQEVHSADAGGEHRPMVRFDVEIEGVQLKAAVFNLNDRSNMDTAILVGQNILQAGNFLINPNKEEQSSEPKMESVADRDVRIMQAVRILAENNVSLTDLITYFNTIKVQTDNE